MAQLDTLLSVFETQIAFRVCYNLGTRPTWKVCVLVVIMPLPILLANRPQHLCDETELCGHGEQRIGDLPDAY